MPLISTPVNIRDRMIQLCHNCNIARTKGEFDIEVARLQGFREAVKLMHPDAYGTMLMNCDRAAIERYPDEEYMTCGVLHTPAWERGDAH